MRELTETEMLWASGGHINGQKDPYSLGFFSSLAKAVWAAPNTIIGGTIGMVGFLADHVFGDGNATITFGNGGIMFENNPLMVNGSALTLGNAQIYYGLGSDLINPNDPSAGTFADHEFAHTQQAGMLGPFFLAVYFGGALVAIFNGHHPLGPGNPLESGPYGYPPSPW